MDKFELILREERIEIVQEGGYYVFIIDGPVIQNQQTHLYDIEEIFEGIKQLDGHGSGLDADTVDGKHADEFALTSHDHDDRYYLKVEIDTLLLEKADRNHSHPEYEYKKLLPFIIALGGL